MQIVIRAVGRLKGRPEADLCARYLDRARAQGRATGISAIEVHEIPESRAETAVLRRGEEAIRLLDGIAATTIAVVLDEAGRAMDSMAFARQLRSWLDGGNRDAVFMIGGPDGHAPAIRERADLLLSLGTMTWPHALTRVMIAEQIYRAVTILVNHPYHRG